MTMTDRFLALLIHIYDRKTERMYEDEQNVNLYEQRV